MINILNSRDELIEILDKKKKFCEIGVFKGDFSKLILQKMDPEELHLIDIFEGQMCSGDKDGNNIVWTSLESEYENLKKTYSDNKVVTLHKGYSQDILETFPNEYFDYIYIDGDHSYEGVKKDLIISFKKIKKDGLICGHDYSKAMFPGVVRAIDEFCNQENYEMKYLTKDGCPSFCLTKK
jgi:hypothetical protein